MKGQVMKKLAFLLISAVLAGSLAYSGGKQKKKIERPSEEEIKKLQTITLTYEIKYGNLHLAWSPATGEDSAGVKVAYSETEKSPLYPFDKYAKWMPGKGHSSCVIPNSKAGSSKTRYYRICSVQQDHRKYVALSNVIEVPAIEKMSCKGGVCTLKKKTDNATTKYKDCKSKGKCCKSKIQNCKSKGECCKSEVDKNTKSSSGCCKKDK